MISAARTQHNAANKVNRTGRGATRRSDGYERAARARQASTSFSEGVGEQTRRQSERAHGGQLVDLAQQRLQPDLAGVGFQLGQQPAPTRTGLVDEQRLQAVGALLVQPRAGQLAESFIERRPRRADDAVESARWFDSLGAAAHQQRLAQLLVPQLDRADLLGQPSGELVLIAASEVAEPERGPHLLAVVLDRPAGPVVAGEQLRVQLQLLGQLGHRRRRHLLSRPREPRLDLEELQQHREPQPSRAGLVPHQRPVLPTSVHNATRSSSDHSIRMTPDPRRPL